MKTGTKIAIGACVAGLAVLLITRVAKAAPSNGFIIKTINYPEGSARYTCALTAAFDFDPAAGSPVLDINKPWTYQGLYKGEPTWKVTTNVVVTVVDADDNLIDQYEAFSTIIENGKSYMFDCATEILS